MLSISLGGQPIGGGQPHRIGNDGLLYRHDLVPDISGFGTGERPSSEFLPMLDLYIHTFGMFDNKLDAD